MSPGTPTCPPSRSPVPGGWRLRPDGALRVLDGGAVLLGGVPLRLFRLGPKAAAHVAGWLADRPVADRPRARALARRLLDAGLVHPLPAEPPDGEVTVVVPACDRPDELARCLAALGRRHPVVVVDDGSVDAGALARVAARAGATLLRRGENGGPAAARNTGLTATSTPFIAFCDSDCVPPPDWIDRLLPHLADPAVAIAAPRITGLAEPGRRGLAAYEHARSALDLGPEPAAVRPGSAVPYVPAAALVARVDALGAGFDEGMRIGEDVDLVWRVAAAGWTVRYDPGVEVPHDHRVGVRPWLATRVAYNEATADLARRHPGALHAAYASRWSLAAWAALAAGRPVAAGGLAAASTVLLRHRLRGLVPGATALALAITGRGLLRDGLDLARAVRGPWLPPVLVAATRARSARRSLAAALIVAPLADRVLHPVRVGSVDDLAWRAVDDAARGLGVWRGCLRHRTVAPLLPGVGVRRAVVAESGTTPRPVA